MVSPDVTHVDEVRPDRASRSFATLKGPSAVPLPSLSINRVSDKPTTDKSPLNPAAGKQSRVLAIASGGGHFVQLRRMRPAWEGCEVHYASTIKDYRDELEPGARFWQLNDANRNEKIKAGWMAVRIAWILLRVRPDVVISTGAAPGYFALRLGKLFGARTIWVDSIANAQELSMTGRMVQKHSDLWLTQWPELATEDGPQFKGSVL